MTTDEKTLWDYEQVARRLGQFKDVEKTVPDVDTVKRLVREGRIPALTMSDRRIVFDPQDIENYIKGLKGEPAISQQKTNISTTSELAKINADIETMEQSKVLHQKTLEYNALRAGFKTAEEYQQALANLKTTEDELKATTTSLTEWETTLKAREIAVKDKEDTIEVVCNEKLTECQNQCDDMIAKTQKECDQMVARKKVEVNKQENTEFNDMEWAVHQFEDIETIINQWDFHDYANELDISINWLVEALNQVLAGELTTQDLKGEFKKAQQIVSNLMEYTQGMKRGADKFVELRNSIGRILDSIVLRLRLDDERRGQKLTPALPSD